MTTTITRTPEQEARRRSTVVWVVGLAFVGLIFDGYDLVVYGTVLSTFLRDPTQIGPVTPAVGGALGSYALVGVLVGALLAGTVADVIGRRKVMLLSYAWFSIGMAITALMTTTTGFGLMRFVTGLGVGALVATTGAIVSEFAPAGEEEPLQRHHLLRCTVREPAGRAARHPPARRDRLAGHVLDRCAADRHAAAAGVLQDARVAELAARPRPRRGGPRALREDRRAAGGGGCHGRPGRRQARADGLRRPVQPGGTRSRRS